MASVPPQGPPAPAVPLGPLVPVMGPIQPQGPVMMAAQPAAPVVAKCPYSLGNDSAAPPKWQQPPQKVVPCDLGSIALTLAVEGQSITVTGTKPAAARSPPSGIDDKVRHLLENYAAVIHHVMPAVVQGGAAPSRTNQVTGDNNVSKIHGRVTMQETMRANCGHHAEVVRAPELKSDDKANTNLRAYLLTIEPKDWSAWDFIKGVFGASDLKEWVYPQRQAVAFEANSCAWPATGPAVGHLSAIVEMMIADEWRIDFRWQQGFAFNFSASSRHTKDHRDGTEIKKSESSYDSSLTKQASEKSDTLMTQNGVAIYHKAETKSDDGMRSVTYNDTTAKSVERDMVTIKPTESAALSGLKAAQDEQTRLSLKKGLAFTITRNWTAVLDTDQWGDTIQALSDKINKINDLIFLLVQLLEKGAKAGIPVSITFGLSVNLRLLQGSFGLRIWPQQVPPLQTGTYFISGYTPKFQGMIDLTVFSLTVSPKITFQAKLIHEYVASGTIELSASITGSATASLSFSDGVASVTQQSIGRIRMSVTAKGEIMVISFYGNVEATASSGMVWMRGIDFDGNALKLSANQLKSHRLEARVTAKYGNKVMDLFGVGSDEPDYQWPAADEPPFVWLEEDALTTSWN